MRLGAMDTHLTSKKNPAHITQPSKRQKASLARRQGGESRRLSTGRLGGGSARVHNLCSLEAMRLVGVEVLITHTPPQLDHHVDQDEQHEHRGADEQQQVELCFSEVEHGSAQLLSPLAWLSTAKHTPVDIGAQVFAAHGPACRAFDRGTVLGGNAADFPVTEALGCGADSL